MSPSSGRVSPRFTRLGLLLAGCFLFSCIPAVWCLPPSVVFNGVAAVLDTGSTPLNHPKGIIVDNSGNVFIADTAHDQIVKMTPAGDVGVFIITGTSLSSPEGLAWDGSGNIYVVDTGNNRPVKLSAAVYNITGLGTALSSPVGLAVDVSGNLY